MKPKLFGTIGLFASAIILNGVCAQQASSPLKFETKITEVPFARIAESHEIDRRCPANGKADNNIYHYAQNAAKNNFLAKGDPVSLSFNDFNKLQAASEKQIETGKIVLQ